MKKKKNIYKTDARMLYIILITLKNLVKLYNTDGALLEKINSNCEKKIKAYKLKEKVEIKKITPEDIEAYVNKVAAAIFDRNENRYYTNINIYFPTLKGFCAIYKGEIRDGTNYIEVKTEEVEVMVLNNLKEYEHANPFETKKIKAILKKERFESIIKKESRNLGWFINNNYSKEIEG